MLLRGENIGGARNSIDPNAIKMLQYSIKTFQRVDDSFFAGLEELLGKLKEYALKKGYVEKTDITTEILKDYVKYWKLEDADKDDDIYGGSERVITEEPWTENFRITYLPSESNYLPANQTEKSKDERFQWYRTIVGLNRGIEPIKREFEIEKIPGLIEDFYKTISPMYGEMAHNELRNATLTVPAEWFTNQEDRVYNAIKDGGEIEFLQADSTFLQLPIAGNATTALIMVHELMHRLISINNKSFYMIDQLNDSESYSLSEKTPSFITQLILGETCSIYAEQLFQDYLTHKHPDVNTSDFLKRFRLHDFISLKDKNFYETERLLEFSKKYECSDELNKDAEQEVTDFVCSTFEWKDVREFPEAFITLKLYEFSHVMGYMYASYLHEKTLAGELTKQEVLDKCTSAFVLSNSDEEKQMELLSEIGAPFIKDGQFVMDEEAIHILYDASVKNMDRGLNADKKRFSLDDISKSIRERKEVKEERTFGETI